MCNCCSVFLILCSKVVMQWTFLLFFFLLLLLGWTEEPCDCQDVLCCLAAPSLYFRIAFQMWILKKREKGLCALLIGMPPAIIIQLCKDFEMLAEDAERWTKYQELLVKMNSWSGGVDSRLGLGYLGLYCRHVCIFLMSLLARTLGYWMFGVGRCSVVGAKRKVCW